MYIQFVLFPQHSFKDEIYIKVIHELVKYLLRHSQPGLTFLDTVSLDSTFFSAASFVIAIPFS